MPSSTASTNCSEDISATESTASPVSSDVEQRLDALLDYPLPPLGDILDYLTQQARHNKRNNNGDEITQQLKEALLSTKFLHHFISLLDEAEGEDDLALVTEIVNLILDVCPDCVHTVLETEENDDYYRNTYPLHIACETYCRDEKIIDRV